ncbi:hypothetical protein EPO05_06560 [Patescibacteria group bacterium]|nr:MAG: hypothetical protein EPO05_06560 [Patescibacteria group bacterium]
MPINLAGRINKLRDLASTGIALLRVAGSVHRQARATEAVHRSVNTLNANLARLVEIQEQHLQLALLRYGADDEALKEEWLKVKHGYSKTQGDAVDQTTLVMDTPGEVLEALDRVAPGSLEERELAGLVSRGGTQSEFNDLLAQHGLGGQFTGALSVKDAVAYDKALRQAEKEQLAELDRAVKELAGNPPARFDEVGNTSDAGEILGGASFGPEPLDPDDDRK